MPCCSHVHHSLVQVDEMIGLFRSISTQPYDNASAPMGVNDFAFTLADSDKSHTHFVIEPCMARLLLQWIWRRRRVSGVGSAALVGPPIGTVQDPPTASGDGACVS